MDDYPDAESWPYLDKLICQWRKEEEAVRSSCGLDPAPPYGRCQLFRNQEPTAEWFREAGMAGDADEPTPQPTRKPRNDNNSNSNNQETGTDHRTTTDEPTESTEEPTEGEEASDFDFEEAGSGAVPTINCGDYTGVNYDRLCSSGDPCCEPLRSDTDYCWENYELVFPGNQIVAACQQCCPGGPKEIGPENPPKQGVPKTIQCSAVENPHRICKANSCCVNPRSTSGYCAGVYELYGDQMEQICHYCCSQPKEIGPANRFLRSADDENYNESFQKGLDESDEHLFESDVVPEGANVTYAYGRKLLLRAENFKEDEEDEQEYFDRVYSDYKHRSMQTTVHEIDYADVLYWPYEWLLKVGTEYYFRYEGTQMVPPCWEVVHWRVMKDPIKVHKRQIDELSRLLAWRRSPSGSNRCALDTAGDVSSDGNTVDVSRRTQYYHLQHRKVFW